MRMVGSRQEPGAGGLRERGGGAGRKGHILPPHGRQRMSVGARVPGPPLRQLLAVVLHLLGVDVVDAAVAAAVAAVAGQGLLRFARARIVLGGRGGVHAAILAQAQCRRSEGVGRVIADAAAGAGAGNASPTLATAAASTRTIAR